MRFVIRLLPLLLVYVLVFAATDLPESPRSDSVRFIWFGENLMQGFYSPMDKINLWNGPGYPIILVPVLGLDLPLVTARLMNIAFMFLGAVYFYLTLRQYAGPRFTIVATYVLGLWPPALRLLPQIMTEPFSILLACGFAFHLSRMHRGQENRRLHLVLASGYLGYLALTRVVFGYVIPTALVILMVVYLIKRSGSLKRDILVCCLALLICLPYLIYTYSITGKVYYWSTAGGMSLYWMSSPYKGELGDWHTMRAAIKDPELEKNHGPFLSGLGALGGVERDDELKRVALRNIRENPAKYLRNWCANLGRLLINYPSSHPTGRLRTLLDMIPGIFLSVLSALCLYPTYAGRGRIPHEIWCLMVVGLAYLGASSLVSAFHRFMLPLVPITILWISLVLLRTVRIEVSR